MSVPNRDQVIAGLRVMAQFLEDNPSIPVNSFVPPTVNYYPDLGKVGVPDRDPRAELERLAKALGAEVTVETVVGRRLAVNRYFGDGARYRASISLPPSCPGCGLELAPDWPDESCGGGCRPTQDASTAAA